MYDIRNIVIIFLPVYKHWILYAFIYIHIETVWNSAVALGMPKRCHYVFHCMLKTSMGDNVWVENWNVKDLQICNY
jgi:hypothetical protein